MRQERLSLGGRQRRQHQLTSLFFWATTPPTPAHLSPLVGDNAANANSPSTSIVHSLSQTQAKYIHMLELAPPSNECCSVSPSHGSMSKVFGSFCSPHINGSILLFEFGFGRAKLARPVGLAKVTSVPGPAASLPSTYIQQCMHICIHTYIQ